MRRGWWPALPLALLALAALVLLVGLVLGPGRPERERATEALRDFARAVAERDGIEACALATPEVQRTIAARVPPLSCAQVVTSFGVGFDGRVVLAARIDGLRVDGDSAFVTRLVAPDGKALMESFDLVRVDGDWRVSRTPARPVTPISD